MAAGKMNRKQRKELARRMQSASPGLEVVHPRAAGIDVGNTAHYVAVRPERALHIGDSLQADAYGAHQAGLQPLWLQRQGGSHTDYPVIQDLRGVLTWLEAHGM